MAAHGQLTLVWTAFNDHYAGPATGQYTTAWNVFGTASGAPGNEGPLMDSVTGAVLPVRLTISSSGTVNQGSASGAPGAGTPAYEVFTGQIDWGSDDKPHAPLVNPGATIDYIFTGLDPNKRYGFVGTGVRGGVGGSYALRWSLVELLDAESFKPAHSTGAAAYTNGLAATQVAINTGQNSTTGDYAAWEEIDPGADGSFTIRCSYYSGPIPTGTAGGPYCYGLMALRLQEFNASPVPAAITTHPTNQTVLEGAPASFNVVVSGNPWPSVQWYRDGAPIEGATNQTLSLPAVSMSDDQAAFYAVASNWVAGTSCMATSLVARLTVQPDLTPPVVVSVLPAANATVSSLKTIEVFFNKPVTNVDASDLLINGSEASQVQMLTPAQYLFSFAQPPPGTVQVAWDTDHRITDLTSS
ncbi:MAG TPA: immunoglobulin domain-containing protein, partial [Verrucomicrobiota bacterium]|nr:immunoglobulin domain-containing protein [Verrucomicrobiota bacterium]